MKSAAKTASLPIMKSAAKTTSLSIMKSAAKTASLLMQKSAAKTESSFHIYIYIYVHIFSLGCLQYPSVETSMIMACVVNILQLSVKYRRTVSVSRNVGDCALYMTNYVCIAYLSSCNVTFPYLG
jgi:hypothetical protein